MYPLIDILRVSAILTDMDTDTLTRIFYGYALRVNYPVPDVWDGVLFSIDFYVSLFLCWQDYEKTAGPICMNFLPAR